MKPIEQLRSILCTGCKSVDKDVKELRFGCRVLNSYSGDIWEYIGKDKAYHKEYGIWIIKENSISDNEIIWNPIKEHHFFTYCQEKEIFFEMNSDWMFYNIYNKINNYDFTKELYEQEDKVLLDIINFLKG